MKGMRGSLILLLVACLWGSTITIQGMAGGTVDVFTFQMLRGFLGALTLTPVVLTGTIPTLREGIGCALMLFAVLLSKSPIGRRAALEAEN